MRHVDIMYLGVLLSLLTILCCSGGVANEKVNFLQRDISKRQTTKAPCVLPSPPENSAFRPHRRLCPEGNNTAACRLVPGTPVPHSWVMYYDCLPGYEHSREVKATLCKDGTFRPTLPACVPARHQPTCADPDTEDSKNQCDDHGSCIKVNSTYKCQCNTGYISDGDSCYAIFPEEGGYLLAFKTNKLLKMPFNLKNIDQTEVLDQFNKVPDAIAVDCVERMIYWHVHSEHKIMKATISGALLPDFIGGGVAETGGFAVDWIGRKLYWADQTQKKIRAASLANGRIEDVVLTNPIQPRRIAVHPGLRKVYWTYQSRTSPIIESANLDGSGRSILVSEGIKLANFLTIDWTTQELCWTDQESPKIECIHLETGVRRIPVPDCGRPTSLAITGEAYYCFDFQYLRLKKALKSALSAPITSIDVPYTLNSRLFEVTAVPARCPRLPS